ncbi:mycothiol transferase [Nocardioides dilutus]
MTSTERTDILEALTKHRELFRFTVQGLTDEQASMRTTASELTLGGLVKHVTATEKEWARFVVEGPREHTVDWANIDWSNPPAEVLEHANGFRMLQGETLAGLLDAYAAVAAATDALVESVDSLDDSHELPSAPWFPPGARWSARRVFLHILAETSQHAGHADIIRESLDGQKSMG